MFWTALRTAFPALRAPPAGPGGLRAFSAAAARARELAELAPAPGSTRQVNRVGRGPGSGRGKTSGRGQKGQHARAGVHPWFEGGQTPITRLFPKVGFRSKRPRVASINLGKIQMLVDQGRLDPAQPITMRELFRTGTLGRLRHGVAVLARGAERLAQPVQLSATRASAAAVARIEELGGSFVAQYYRPLGLRTLTRPEAALRRYARVPIRARPVDRRSIEFYREPANRGYLVGAPGAPQVKPPYQRRAAAVSPLVARLQALEAADPSAAGAQGFVASEKAAVAAKAARPSPN